MTRVVHRCVTVFYQQIEGGNIANHIHGFTIDYGKFILKRNSTNRSTNEIAGNSLFNSEIIQKYIITSVFNFEM